MSIREQLTLGGCAENAFPNGSDTSVLNASLALFVAKGSCSPNPSKVVVPVTSEKVSAFVSFVSSVFFVSYLFFTRIYKCHYNSHRKVD